MMIYLVTFMILLLLAFNIRLLVIKKSLDKLENNIKNAFNKRTHMIPAIFEVTQNSFSKHDEVFEEILKHRKKELYKYYQKELSDNKDNDFIKLIHIERLIYHELNFIFKVSNKHPKLNKKGNFIYLRDLLINRSTDADKLLNQYKVKANKFNKLLKIKNFTIIGILVFINKKQIV